MDGSGDYQHERDRAIEKDGRRNNRAWFWYGVLMGGAAVLVASYALYLVVAWWFLRG